MHKSNAAVFLRIACVLLAVFLAFAAVSCKKDLTARLRELMGPQATDNPQYDITITWGYTPRSDMTQVPEDIAASIPEDNRKNY